jgi:hypothetical protein
MRSDSQTIRQMKREGRLPSLVELAVGLANAHVGVAQIDREEKIAEPETDKFGLQVHSN